MPVTPITSYEQFREIINGDKPVVIDFWATWCGPCKMMSPSFEKLSDEFGDVGFYKVDVDAQEQIASQVGITAMPAFMIFKDGQKVNEFVGANATHLENLIREAVSS